MFVNACKINNHSVCTLTPGPSPLKGEGCVLLPSPLRGEGLGVRVNQISKSLLISKVLSMKHWHIFICIAFLICLLTWGNATTLGVSLNGSQPYTIIQEAITASADGDTILVYPGRYMENVDYIGKNITIASLELTTGNPAYRDSTIIDGNQSGSVIKSVTLTSHAGIYGFTLTNGSGSALAYYQGVQVNLGGGIAVHDAISFYVSNCIIINNLAYWGGGIWIYQSTIHAKDTIIRDNFATMGGGILMNYHGQVVFDQVNRCSIYNNTSGNGQDILATDTRLETSVYLDMGTICPINNYYVSYIKSVPDWTGGFPVIDIQRGYRTEINHDLYVSPLGDDANDGLSVTTPLKNIYRAMQLVASDSLNQKTVHLASGVYSTNDGQFFPISMKPQVKLSGNIDSLPVLENLNSRETITASRANDASIENMVIDYGHNSQGGVGIGASISDRFKLKNIHILPHQSEVWKGIVIASNTYYPVSCELEDVYISGQSAPEVAGLEINTVDALIKGLTIDGCHNTGDEFDNPMGIFYFHGNKLTMENSKIINNTMAYEDKPVVSIGAASYNSDSRLIMNNVLIANNQSGGYTPLSLSAFTDSTSVISNCTFANNSGGSIANILNGNLRIANCIFDNDTQLEILCQGTYPNTVSQVSFENNFIRGYPNSFSSSPVNQISFNEVVLTGNPGFCSSDADDYLSYRLGNSSQCRDAGTADTTGLFLPYFDLYGNPRIYGSAIDIGCSEWSFPVSLDDHIIPLGMVVSAYPNPFTESVNIRYDLSKAARVKLQIYNLKGQLVRTLLNENQGKGEQFTLWEGCNDSGRPVASGIYLLLTEIDGRMQRITKLVKLKQ